LFSDATISVHGIEFYVHKCILAARYAFFKKMFTGGWKEGEENAAIIKEMSPEVFRIILEFIYKGELADWKAKLEKYADDLIKATDMLGIDGLRGKCEKYLIREGKINVETACKYFILADKHQAPELKAKAWHFISENLDEVEKTSGYKELERHQTSPAQLVKLLPPLKRPKLF